jgi:hypothetical protein
LRNEAVVEQPFQRVTQHVAKRNDTVFCLQGIFVPAIFGVSIMAFTRCSARFAPFP